MEEDFKQEVRANFSKLNEKLDSYHKQTVVNKNDIQWLKRGVLGIYSAVGAWVYIKLTGNA